MFDGFKMLCLGPIGEKYSFKHCLNSMIVPEGKFLKAANIQFSCPSCGYKNSHLQLYFKSVLELRRAFGDIKKSGIGVRYYELAFESSYEDGFDDKTSYFLEKNDWSTWNMQISSITISDLEQPSLRVDLWEDHNFKAQPFYHPSQSVVTFEYILKENSLFLGDKEIDVNTLKNFIEVVRNYNSAWRELVDNGFTAAPVDLNDSLLTRLSGTNSLVELFSDDDQI